MRSSNPSRLRLRSFQRLPVMLLPLVLALADAAASESETEVRLSADRTRNTAGRARGTGKLAPPTMATVRAKLELAERTLGFVEKTEARPALAAELKRVAKEIHGAGVGGNVPALFEKISALRKRIVYSHPGLDFERLLINVNPPPLYSHNCDQYLGRHSRQGKGPIILTDWKTDSPKVERILSDKLPKGAYNKPKLSWDASRVVFAFSDHTLPEDHTPTAKKHGRNKEANRNKRRYFVYEGSIDGSWVKQVTGTPDDPMERWGGRVTSLIEDNDPCYLSDGGIAFVSSRCQGYGRCHNGRYTPSFLLYRVERDGSKLIQLSYGEANETDPVSLPDGRLVYTRWDYINRHVTKYHMLWWKNPDGTGVSNFYGSNTEKPWMISETVPIPGSSKIVALGTGHHSFSTGTVLLIDPNVGEDGEQPVKRITPEVGYFEAEKIVSDGCYSTPWPLTEDLFLVSYSPSRIPGQGKMPPDNYAIYLIDTLGGRELVYRDPDGMSCFSPTPVLKRPHPDRLAPSRDGTSKTGTLLVQDVYINRHDPGGAIHRGTIKALRINAIINQPAVLKNKGAQPSMIRHEVVKKVLGTVPVYEDGSAHFQVPAGKPLQLQAIDQNGMAVMTMRTFVDLMPGETRGCIGCHENRINSPRPKSTMAMRRATDEIRPSRASNYEGGFSYAKTVQPVLDRYCIMCHGLKEKKGGIDLTGIREQQKLPEEYMTSMTGPVLRSYNTFFARTGLLAPAVFRQETNTSKPREYFAASSGLATMLLKGHGKLKLDRDSMTSILEWLDLNCQAYGDYSWNRIETRPADPDGEKKLRIFIGQRFGGELAGQPYETLVNVGMPERSRILKAPLAVSAGGWGQLTPAWSATTDPGYQKMRELVEASIQPLQYHDVHGTCGREFQGGKCICRSCWVKAVEDEFRSKQTASAKWPLRWPPGVAAGVRNLP